VVTILCIYDYVFLQEVPSTLWFMAVTLDRKKDRLFDFIQEQIRLSRLPAAKTFITGICVIQFHVSARQVALLR